MKIHFGAIGYRLILALLCTECIPTNVFSAPAALTSLLRGGERSYTAKYTIQCSDVANFCDAEFTVFYSVTEHKRFVKRVDYDINRNITRLLIININGLRKGYSAIANYEGDGRRILKFRKTDDPMVEINTHVVPMFWKLLRPPSLLTLMNFSLQKQSLDSILDNKKYPLSLANTGGVFVSVFTSDANPKFRRSYFFGESLDKANIRPVKHILENANYKEVATVNSMDGDHPSEILFEESGAQSIKTKLTIQEFSYADKIDSSYFALENMGLKVGTLIGYPELSDMKQYPVWNGRSTNETFGDEYERQKQEVTATPTTPKPSLISQAWPYFLGFVVFAVFGFWLLRKQRQVAKE